MNQEDQQSSITTLGEKVAAHPDNVKDIHDLADAYADQGCWSDAIKTYEAAIGLDPTDAVLHNSLGTVNEEAGKFFEAERAYQQAIVLSPKDSMAYYNLGTMYEEQRRTKEAVQAYEKCLKYSTDPGERSEVKQRLIGITSQTSTGQSRLAYRLAAVALFLGVIINVINAIMGGSPMIIAVVIDFILAIGLIQLRTGARNFTLFRAVIGAILWPILLFAESDLTTGIVTSIIQWGYCGSIILLLTGRTKTWRLALAAGIFGVFVLGIYSILLLLVVLAQLTGL